ncbi:class I SAM-dependent methyltransferase [Haloferula sp. A504]|uniref:class I SAM-dependent methyltransferase n=1 Tax=Haloferula sp. A504 TaxID=3373601 RepID=UPI0031C8FC32|nr:class I SAM-dependent rRNA methyltransferase [Verrucomicrobiaceae bacterium E54]
MRLLPRAEAAVRRGHPWIFAESIKSQNREGDAGELVVLYDRRDRFLAAGWYDPDSPIRVRVVCAGEPATIDRAWWLGRAREAAALREPVFSSGETTGARCVNGESDGFPGLVADRYADTLVVKLYSAVWLGRWAEIEGVLREVFEPEHLVLRFSRNLREAAGAAGLKEGFRGAEGEEMVVFRENGLRFEAEVLRGQKTGFFLDQRDNRSRVEALAAGRKVLNLFSFSGGFSAYAARGGARRIVDVDISAHALASARRNLALNPELGGVPHDGVKADVFEWLEQSRDVFDLVVCDPPSLAKRDRDRDGALSAYRRLNAAALARLAPGGRLVSASCSAHIPTDPFFTLVRGEAARSGRGFRELWTSGHAADHPATFPEASYLKAICLEVD